MVVLLRLADGRHAYTQLEVAPQEQDQPLAVLKAIFEQNPTGWIDGYGDRFFARGQRLVNIAQIVTAELD